MIQSFQGHEPKVDAEAWVHDGAVLIGEVELAANVSIWPGAVLRGDMGVIRVGAFSNIQDGAVCHNTGGVSITEVGERCTIGHGAVLHGCRVGDDCLVGMGSIVMDNAVIGAGSMVAAGSVVPPGKIFPPGSVILGNPGRVVRQVRPSDTAMIDHGWRTYLETVALYR